MRRTLPFILILCAVAACFIAARALMGGVQPFAALWHGDTADAISDSWSSDSPHESGIASSERLTAIELYEDIDYGFKVAIPVGWRKIVTVDAVADAEGSADSGFGAGQDPLSSDAPLSLEPGYAVGFESVQQDVDDRFADYILIEVLPGTESGRFDADQSLSIPVTVDGRHTWFDRLEIDQASSGLVDVDLVVYQAELSGVGYTVGLYAIGEPIREPLLAMAFEVMLQTFEIIRDPFTVS